MAGTGKGCGRGRLDGTINDGADLTLDDLTNDDLDDLETLDDFGRASVDRRLWGITSSISSNITEARHSSPSGAGVWAGLNSLLSNSTKIPSLTWSYSPLGSGSGMMLGSGIGSGIVIAVGSGPLSAVGSCFMSMGGMPEICLCSGRMRTSTEWMGPGMDGPRMKGVGTQVVMSASSSTTPTIMGEPTSHSA